MKCVQDDLIGDAKQVYLIGIGGVGMSALARVLRKRGLSVMGSDAKESKRTRQMNQEGIGIRIAPKDVSFDNIDLVIYSSAIDQDHLELQAAKQSSARVHHRAEVLASIVNQAATSVGITGTHGKTTTSSMISFVLSQLGKEPTCFVGGDVQNFKSNALYGNPDLCISEVDESDQTHQLYAPNYAIITNLEDDHVDNYQDPAQLEKSFENFFENVSNPGALIYNMDDERLRDLVEKSGKTRISFGLCGTADFSARNIHQANFGVEFDLFEVGFYAGTFQLAVPGVHNVYNALATIALLIQLGVEIELIQKALKMFQGTKRRLEVIAEEAGISVVDDYAHHPTEVVASISAMKATAQPVTVIFQPHRYSRTQHFSKDFAKSLHDADEIVLTHIYGAGEDNPDEIDIQCIYREMIAQGHAKVRILNREEIVSYLSQCDSLSGYVAFLGAGDIGEIAHEFASRLKSLTTA